MTKDENDTKSKIAACESEIESLKERIRQLEGIITEQDMQVKRGRNSVVLRTKDICLVEYGSSRIKATPQPGRRQERK